MAECCKVMVCHPIVTNQTSVNKVAGKGVRSELSELSNACNLNSLTRDNANPHGVY